MRATERIMVEPDVFIGFLARDSEQHFQRAKALFESAERGDVRLYATEVAIAEVVRRLVREYNMQRHGVVSVLEAILGTKNLAIPNRRAMEKALALYKEGGIGFMEAYSAAFMKANRMKILATFRPADYKTAEGMEIYA